MIGLDAREPPRHEPGAAEALAEGGGGSSADGGVPSATRLGVEAATKLADLRQKRALLLVENTEKWPEVKEIDKQIAVLENQVQVAGARARTVVTTNLATRYRQALASSRFLFRRRSQPLKISSLWRSLPKPFQKPFLVDRFDYQSASLLVFQSDEPDRPATGLQHARKVLQPAKSCIENHLHISRRNR